VKIRFSLVSAALAAAAVVFLAAGAFAEPWQKEKSEYQQEINAILAQASSQQIGSMTVADAQKLLGDLSIVRQKAHYVQRARMASFMMPGAGQFMAGDAVGGSLFLVGDLAIFAGTLVGAYFLLPASVQYGSGPGTTGLDYWGAPLADIKTAWISNSILSYLPSVGVMAGGMILRGLLGLWSSKSAGALARQNIADGKITFEPELMPLTGGFGPGMGMGMMMRWHY
jgi:hypothetical protein